MDRVNVTKIHDPPSPKRYFPPPDEHAQYKENFVTRNGELSKVTTDIKTVAQDRCSIFVR